MSNFFTREEFLCPCCKEEEMAIRFLEKLEDARKIAEIPFVITSGWRCRKHNLEVGGTPRSAHLTGYAADIRATTSHERYRILLGAFLASFNRIGIAESFIHLDCDPYLPKNMIWLYGRKK